jgi:hypothetical protein
MLFVYMSGAWCADDLSLFQMFVNSGIEMLNVMLICGSLVCFFCLLLVHNIG